MALELMILRAAQSVKRCEIAAAGLLTPQRRVSGRRCLGSDINTPNCVGKLQLQNDLEEIKKAGTYKRERVITSSQSAHITVNTAKGPVLVSDDSVTGVDV